MSSDRIRLDSGEEPQRTAPDPAAPAREESPPPSPTPETAEQETSGESSEQQQQQQEPSEAQRRLDRLTREKYEAQRQRDELAALLQQQQAAQYQPQQQQPADPVEAARQDGFRQAHEAAVAREFNTACNELFQKGQAEYSDMQDAVGALNAVGYGNRPDVLAALTRLPDGHRVYRQLASDLDNAARILTLDPMGWQLELARMASQSGTGSTSVSRETSLPAPNATRAPAPLRPVGGNSAAPRKRLDQMTMAEFIRERERGSRPSKISR